MPLCHPGKPFESVRLRWYPSSVSAYSSELVPRLKLNTPLTLALPRASLPALAPEVAQTDHAVPEYEWNDYRMLQANFGRKNLFIISTPNRNTFPQKFLSASVTSCYFLNPMPHEREATPACRGDAQEHVYCHCCAPK